MDKPLNVLFVIADQFRADALGCAGNPVVRTPNLDRLAAAGTRFTHCFNQTAPCGPSRMAIYTGRYMCSHRAINNMTPLRDAEENFGYHLRRAGHNPGLIGYNDYGVDPATLPKGDPRTSGLSYDNVLPGFEDYYYHEYDSQEYFEHLRQKGYPEALLNHNAIHSPAVPPAGPGANLPQHYPAQYTKEDSECRFLTDKAIQYIRQRPQGWVLSLNYIKPHPPNICCPPYHDMYDPAAMPAPIRRPQELAPTHPYLQLLSPDQLQDDLHLRQYRACYYGMITEVDHNLGLIFATLEALDQWDNTLIIFTADHAELPRRPLSDRQGPLPRQHHAHPLPHPRSFTRGRPHPRPSLRRLRRGHRYRPHHPRGHECARPRPFPRPQPLGSFAQQPGL